MSLEHRSGTPFHNIPTKRQSEYNNWLRTMAHLFPNAEAAIRDALSAHINGWLLQNQGTTHAAFCSSWIPGSDWGKGAGVYQPIYLTMMHLYGNRDLAHPRAGWFFGLILMDLMIHRPDAWECWHEVQQPKDDPEGLYYRPRRQPIHQLAKAG
jgi:hypothetical protein